MKRYLLGAAAVAAMALLSQNAFAQAMATPGKDVSMVLLPKFDTQMLPPASMARAKASRSLASGPKPAEGERTAPGVVADAPASSEMEGPR